MRYLRYFENKFKSKDSSQYIEEYWDVDGFQLYDILKDEFEDESIKEIHFEFEDSDKHIYQMFDLFDSQVKRGSWWMSTKGAISKIDTEHDIWEFMERKDSELKYPVRDRFTGLIIYSDITTSAFYEFTDNNGHTTNLFPEFELAFDENSEASNMDSGELVDIINDLFDTYKIPYMIDCEFPYVGDGYGGGTSNRGRRKYYDCIHI